MWQEIRKQLELLSRMYGFEIGKGEGQIEIYVLSYDCGGSLRDYEIRIGGENGYLIDYVQGLYRLMGVLEGMEAAFRLLCQDNVLNPERKVEILKMFAGAKGDVSLPLKDAERIKSAMIRATHYANHCTNEALEISRDHGRAVEQDFDRLDTAIDTLSKAIEKAKE